MSFGHFISNKIYVNAVLGYLTYNSARVFHEQTLDRQSLLATYARDARAQMIDGQKKNSAIAARVFHEAFAQ